jgi:hypothetical protein
MLEGYTEVNMIAAIVTRLNTVFPSVKAVKFGDPELPTPPYAVVKKERDIAGRGFAYRIIGHFQPGQQIFLDDYMINTVSDALRGWEGTDRHGNTHTLYEDNDDFNDLLIDNKDGTISMEKVFYSPGVVY